MAVCRHLTLAGFRQQMLQVLIVEGFDQVLLVDSVAVSFIFV